MNDSRSQYIQFVKSRLAWANHRIQELDTDIGAFLNSNPRPYDLVEEAHPYGTSDYIVAHIFKVRQQPTDALSLAAGDAIHNLRATLDNLMWASGQVFAKTRRERNDLDKLSLEFRQSESDFLTVYLPKIARFPKEIQDWVTSIQPYNRPNQKHILHILNLLWNRDKHRLPLILAAHVASVTFSRQPGVLQAQIKGFTGSKPVLGGGFLKDGDKATEYITPAQDVGKLYVDFTADIAFGQGAPTVVRQFLRDVYTNIANEVIPIFEPFFPK